MGYFHEEFTDQSDEYPTESQMARMKTVQVEALKTHNYNGQWRVKGAIYQVEAKDAHILTVIGHVKVVASESKDRYKRRDMRAKD